MVNPNIYTALLDIAQEYRRARSQHPQMNSGHEGYAVILEELDELWNEVKANRSATADAYKEATQVAAMALAFMLEIATD